MLSRVLRKIVSNPKKCAISNPLLYRQFSTINEAKINSYNNQIKVVESQINAHKIQSYNKIVKQIITTDNKTETYNFIENLVKNDVEILKDLVEKNDKIIDQNIKNSVKNESKSNIINIEMIKNILSICLVAPFIIACIFIIYRIAIASLVSAIYLLMILIWILL